MELQGLIIFALVWFVVGLLGKAGKKQRQPTASRPRPPRPTPQPGVDPTQQEGSRLEIMLREFQRALEDAGDRSRSLPPGRPDYRDPGEGRSLEEEPVVVSLEGIGARLERRPVDHDDEAEQIVARRLKAAAARDATSSPVDHTAFARRIRQEPTEHTATRGYSPKQLRDAMVWREILGPPVTLRRESDLDSSS